MAEEFVVVANNKDEKTIDVAAAVALTSCLESEIETIENASGNLEGDVTTEQLSLVQEKLDIASPEREEKEPEKEEDDNHKGIIEKEGDKCEGSAPPPVSEQSHLLKADHMEEGKTEKREETEILSCSPVKEVKDDASNHLEVTVTPKGSKTEPNLTAPVASSSLLLDLYKQNEDKRPEEVDHDVKKKKQLSPLLGNTFPNFRTRLQRMKQKQSAITRRTNLSSSLSSRPHIPPNERALEKEVDTIEALSPSSETTETETPTMSPNNVEGEKKQARIAKERQQAEKKPSSGSSSISSLATLFSTSSSSSSSSQVEPDGEVSDKDDATSDKLSIPKLDQQKATEPKESASSIGGSLLSNFQIMSGTSGGEGEAQDQEMPHCFELHSFKKPTNCDICQGLLVGLWKQGLKCKTCGMKVHRGEGVDGHDNCRAEALLAGCRGCQRNPGSNDASSSSDDDDEPVQVRQVIKQFRQLAKEQPNLLRSAKAQLDRDINSKVKEIIVSKGAEKEKTKKFLRAKNAIQPIVQRMDNIEEQYGWVCIFGALFAGHLAVATLFGTACWVGFLTLILPRHDVFAASSLAWIHAPTVIFAFHIAIVALIVLLRRLVNLMNRKSNLLDQCLKDFLKLEAEQDLGISINGIANRAQLWTKRLLITSSCTCLLTLWFWHNTSLATQGGNPSMIATTEL